VQRAREQAGPRPAGGVAERRVGCCDGQRGERSAGGGAPGQVAGRLRPARRHARLGARGRPHGGRGANLQLPGAVRLHCGGRTVVGRVAEVVTRARWRREQSRRRAEGKLHDGARGHGRTGRHRTRAVWHRGVARLGGGRDRRSRDERGTEPDEAEQPWGAHVGGRRTARNVPERSSPPELCSAHVPCRVSRARAPKWRRPVTSKKASKSTSAESGACPLTTPLSARTAGPAVSVTSSAPETAVPPWPVITSTPARVAVVGLVWTAW